MDKTVETMAQEMSDLVDDEQLAGETFTPLSGARIIRCFKAVPKAQQRGVYARLKEMITERRLHVS